MPDPESLLCASPASWPVASAPTVRRVDEEQPHLFTAATQVTRSLEQGEPPSEDGPPTRYSLFR